MQFKEDTRPPKGSWAPGGYVCKCLTCRAVFIGAKRAMACADCAYGAKEDALSDILAAERAARKRLNALQAERAAIDAACQATLGDLNALKQEAYRLGFKGNIMRDADGNRVRVLSRSD